MDAVNPHAGAESGVSQAYYLRVALSVIAPLRHIFLRDAVLEERPLSPSIEPAICFRDLPHHAKELLSTWIATALPRMRARRSVLGTMRPIARCP